MFVYKEPSDEPVLNTENPDVKWNPKEKPYITGDRMSTFMIYLSEVKSYLAP